MKKYSKLSTLLLTSALLLACSGLEQSERRKVREENELVDAISRKEGEQLYPQVVLSKAEPPSYPWQEAWMGSIPRITKEFFRCQGKALNPPKTILKAGKDNLTFYDCQGSYEHGLPIDPQKPGSEHVYPSLLTLLNYLQDQSKKPVVITSGHCCPKHWNYLHAGKEQKEHKHMIGAAVDFYLDAEDSAYVIGLLKKFYQEQEPDLGSLKEKEGDPSVWTNKEIYLKLYSSSEESNFDNEKTPYHFCLQLRYDKVNKKLLTFRWEDSYRYQRR